MGFDDGRGKLHPVTPTASIKPTVVLCRVEALRPEVFVVKGGKMVEESLRDGTLVRHKVEGYKGYVDGITRIKELFTERGQPLDNPKSNQLFQYRIMLEGESLRRIAPAADVEILEEIVSGARRKKLLKGPSAREKEGARKAKQPIVVK